MVELSLYDFLLQAWQVIEPGTAFEANWHIGYIAEYLEAVYAGETRRLIINQPPRSLKSLLVSVCWPAWCWTRDPSLRWMFASYSQSLSSFHSLLRRELIRSAWYQGQWPVKLCGDQNQKTEFANTRRGVMIATSVGGTSIGKGGDILVFDDPLNPTEAASPAMRETANTWVRRSFLTRLNDPRSGRIVGVMQRLHEQDTSGMLLAMGGWTHLCLPAEAEKSERMIFPMSGQVIERAPGELLFPAREDRAALERKKIELGSYGYAGQYQQRPSPAEGGVLKRHWWRFWYPREGVAPEPVTLRREDGSLATCAQTPLPDAWDEVLHSWDMAFKGSDASDFVVGQCWARRGAEKYLLEQLRQRADFPATIRLVLELLRRHPEAGAVLVEDKANGPAVLQVLRREVSGLIAVNPAGGKEARVHAVAPGIEAGDVYLPHPSLHPWVWEFIERAAAFPNAAHDDELDALSQALLRLQRRAIDWPSEEAAEEDGWRELLSRLGVEPVEVEIATGW